MVYICIPVHDEARTVGVLLWKVRKVMAELARDFEILVLDDGSTDDTAATLARYRRVMPLTILHSPQRLGYARSLERLLREVVRRASYPKRDVAVTLQADLTDDPAQVATLVRSIEGGADVVAGCVPRRGRVPRPPGWAHRLAPWALGEVYGRAPVSDPLCGFRAYRVIMLKKVLREDGDGALLSTEGWAANVELLGLVVPHARRIEETALAVRHQLRVRPSRVRSLQTLGQLLRVRRRAWFTPGGVM